MKPHTKTKNFSPQFVRSLTDNFKRDTEKTSSLSLPENDSHTHTHSYKVNAHHHRQHLTIDSFNPILKRRLFRAIYSTFITYFRNNNLHNLHIFVIIFWFQRYSQSYKLIFNSVWIHAVTNFTEFIPGEMMRTRRKNRDGKSLLFSYQVMFFAQEKWNSILQFV